MKYTIYKSEDRGTANFGWLQARQTFSFGSWYHPDRVHFGVLRVLNDDIIAAGSGFPQHPHDNMEIITIPLSGTLEHQDSMGNKAQILAGEVQVMSAGTGVQHSEYNVSDKEELRLFQIWMFPNKRNFTPRYDQITIDTTHNDDSLVQVVSPSPDDAGTWIHQDAWIYMGNFNKEKVLEYKLKGNNHGVFVMVVDGTIKIDDHILNRRDAIGIENRGVITIEMQENSRLLVMEVPMDLPA